MRRTAAKALTGMLCATLALVGGLVLTGCSGADPEEAVRADITTNFDQLKNLEGDALEEIADGMGTTGLEQYGLENTEVITAMLDGFDTRSTPSRSTATPPRRRSPSRPSP